MKNNKGITLIALVVTIIVLLILAGVSIAMLTGENGILTNASKTSTENAYYGAEEQVKLAFMAVKTEIMAQTVKSGTYNPQDHGEDLANIVRKDLADTAKWTKVQFNSTNNKIEITYTDKYIDAGVIGSKTYQDKNLPLTAQQPPARTIEAPQHEGYVNYTITLYDNSIQDATLECDL